MNNNRSRMMIEKLSNSISLGINDRDMKTWLKKSSNNFEKLCIQTISKTLANSNGKTKPSPKETFA